MAAPLTLIEVATAEVRIAEGAKDTASQALKAAQDEQSAADKEVEAKNKEVEQLVRDERDLRAKLSKGETDAEIDDLQQKIRKTVGDLREARLVSARKTAAGERWRRRTSPLQEELARATAGAARTATDLEAATKGRADRDGQRARGTVAKDAAKATLDGATGKDAEKAAREGMPKPLFDRIRDRATKRFDRAIRARQAEQDARATAAARLGLDGGATGKSEEARMAAAIADMKLGEILDGADGRIASALAVLEEVKAAPKPAEEDTKALISAVTQDVETAIGNEQALADAQSQVDIDTAAVDAALIKARSDDPDGDPETVAAVKAATAKLAASTAVRDTATAAYTKDQRAAVKDLAEMVPPPWYQLVEKFLRAERTLTDVSTADVGALV
jgi:predicted  nucleic acid-binding Zn-ribbon protein